MTSKLDPRFNEPRFSTRVEITVPFHDADAMGVVWHGNYFRYLEIAREQLLKQFDYGYRQMQASGYVWPIVDTRLKYIAPVLFEQRIEVRAQLEEIENRLRIGYQIYQKALEKGLILRPLGNVLYFNPPLTITETELDEAVGLCAEAIAEILGS